jgi:hypothetical protein
VSPRAPQIRSYGMGPLAPGPVPRDLIALFATLFVTFSLQFFASTAAIPALLRLSAAVWQRGFVWQVLTYPFIGVGSPSPWIVIELIFLFGFARAVRSALAPRRFWRLVVSAAVVAALGALAVRALAGEGAEAGVGAFTLMQGQRILWMLLIAAYAIVFRGTTVMVFFVIPVRAELFLPLEVLFAFVAFLATRDLAGFVGLCLGAAAVWVLLQPQGWRRGLREQRLRLERWWIERRLARLRRKSGLKVVRGGASGRDLDRWVN